MDPGNSSSAGNNSTEALKAQEEELKALPTPATKGIYEAGEGIDPEKWRLHVERAFELKGQNRAKQRLFELQTRVEQEWKERTSLDNVHPDDIHERDLFKEGFDGSGCKVGDKNAKKDGVSDKDTNEIEID